MRVDVKYAANLKEGDIYAGMIVPDAPTRPVQEFSHAWTIAGVETLVIDDKKHTQPYARQGDDVVSLEPLPLGRQVMVIVP